MAKKETIQNPNGDYATGAITLVEGVSFTAEHENRCVRRGNVCEVHFTINKTDGTAFTASDTATTVAYISGIPYPPSIIRKTCGCGNGAWLLNKPCYVGLFNDQHGIMVAPSVDCNVIGVDFVYTLN